MWGICMGDRECLKQAVVRELAGFLVEDEGASIESALDEVERSPILEKVLDEDTGLYLASPAHVYEYFKEARQDA